MLKLFLVQLFIYSFSILHDDDVPYYDNSSTSPFLDNSKYEGDFENGKYNGYGIYQRADGMKFQGQFKGGQVDGRYS